MIELFDKRYYAISNLFISDYEGKEYVFPSPLSFIATMENEAKQLKNRIEIIFSNFYDSPLILPYSFDLFFYLLTFEYTIHTFKGVDLLVIDKSSDTRGHKGTYSFINDRITLNIGDTEIYDDYKKFKTKTAIQTATC